MMNSAPANYHTRIQAFRTRHDLTQEDLAHQLGTSWVTISRWERKQNKPSRLAWQRFCQISAKKKPRR